MTFPQELAERRQWICWRLEPSMKGDRPNKTPYSPHSSRRASSIDPTTWGTLEEAQKACEKYNYTGLGFVFTNDDDFVGVDIDHCRNKDTAAERNGRGDHLEAETYTEISLGRGATSVLSWNNPSRRNKNSKTGVEMYAYGRYFTMTGNRLDNAHCLCRRIPALWRGSMRQYQTIETGESGETEKRKAETALRNRKQRRIRRGRARARSCRYKDELFAKLWSGRWEEQYDSQSEADMALCCKLAFRTGKNRDQTDRLSGRASCIGTNGTNGTMPTARRTERKRSQKRSIWSRTPLARRQTRRCLNSRADITAPKAIR
jgi:primase-polymerase (primpol)-like protein